MAHGERVASALRVHDFLQQTPLTTANRLVQQTGLTAPTVNLALIDLQALGIIAEITGRRRGRIFGYSAYLSILNEGTNPIR